MALCNEVQTGDPRFHRQAGWTRLVTGGDLGVIMGSTYSDQALLPRCHEDVGNPMYAQSAQEWFNQLSDDTAMSIVVMRRSMLHNYQAQAFPMGRPVKPPRPPSADVISLWAESDRLKARANAGRWHRTGENIKSAFVREGRTETGTKSRWRICGGAEQEATEKPPKAANMLPLPPGAGLSPDSLGRPNGAPLPQSAGMRMPPPPAVPMPAGMVPPGQADAISGPDPLIDDGTGPDEPPAGTRRWYENLNPYANFNYKWNRIDGIKNAHPGAQNQNLAPTQQGQGPQQALPLSFPQGMPQPGFLPGQQQQYMPPQFAGGAQPYGLYPTQQGPMGLGQQPPYTPGQHPPYGSGQQPPYGPGQQLPMAPGQQPPFMSGQQPPYLLGQKPPGLGQYPAGPNQFQPGQSQLGQMPQGQMPSGQLPYGQNLGQPNAGPQVLGQRPPFSAGLIPAYYPGGAAGRPPFPPGSPNPYLPNPGPRPMNAPAQQQQGYAVQAVQQPAGSSFSQGTGGQTSPFAQGALVQANSQQPGFNPPPGSLGPTTSMDQMRPLQPQQSRPALQSLPEGSALQTAPSGSQPSKVAFSGVPPAAAPSPTGSSSLGAATPTPAPAAGAHSSVASTAAAAAGQPLASSGQQAAATLPASGGRPGSSSSGQPAGATVAASGSRPGSSSGSRRGSSTGNPSTASGAVARPVMPTTTGSDIDSDNDSGDVVPVSSGLLPTPGTERTPSTTVGDLTKSSSGGARASSTGLPPRP